MSAPAIISSGTAAGGPPVGGSGTTNTIPRWTGPSTLGDSVITQDTTTGVNIRVNAATSVYATANRTAIELNGTTSSLLGFAVGGVASGYLTASASSMLLTAGASRPLQLGASNAIGMTFDTSNNVGIGTASPGQTLDIRNTASYQLRVGSSPGFSYDIGRSTADGLLYFYGNQTGANGFVFSGINGERARIDSAGRFGIGTASPDSTLHVVGAASSQLRIGYSGLSQNYYDAGDHFFRSAGGVANRMSITSLSVDVSFAGYGLKLPATPGNADTQTLDAYRENTFTPTIQGGTTAGVGTYTSQVGTFTIIGRCLFFNVEIAWSAHTGTGPVQLAGLPVAAAQLATFGLDSNYAAAGYLRMSAGNTFAQINTINVPATGNYRVSGCYFIV